LACILIKQQQLRLIHINWKKKNLTGSVLDVKCGGRPQKYAGVDVSTHFEESVLSSPRKSMNKWSADFQIP
jgi:hypothetical protein